MRASWRARDVKARRGLLPPGFSILAWPRVKLEFYFVIVVWEYNFNVKFVLLVFKIVFK